MNLALLVFWGLVGICPPWWPFPRWKFPPPPPPPDWWFRGILTIAGIVGGISGGWLYNQTWPISQTMTGVDVAATAVGAVVGSVILTQFSDMALSARMNRET